MPQIIPIRDLKNTTEISQLCHSTDSPIFITKNGYGDKVIMSMDAYEKSMYLKNISEKLALAEQQLAAGEVEEATSSLKALRGKYGL